MYEYMKYSFGIPRLVNILISHLLLQKELQFDDTFIFLAFAYIC